MHPSIIRRALAAALLLLLLAVAPFAAAKGFDNAGNVAYLRALAPGALADGAPGGGTRGAPIARTLWMASAADKAALEKAADLCGWALSFNPADGGARPCVGRAQLALGQYTEAAQALDAVTCRPGQNFFACQDRLMAHSQLGDHAGVVSLYENDPELAAHSQLISETVALAYLAQPATGANAAANAVAALRLHPGDLPATYRLWQVADEADRAALADALRRYPPAAVDLAQERLLDPLAEAVPALLDAGIWDDAAAERLVGFLVWRHSPAAGVERLLQSLAQRQPGRAVWPFDLGELYQRRGAAAQAEAAYRQALALDAAYAPAYLRLGLLAEQACAEQAACPARADAARWYVEYHRRTPDDLLGLVRLATVATQLGMPNAAALQAAWAQRSDDAEALAVWLGQTASAAHLGPNLLANAGFEDWTSRAPANWGISDMATGVVRNPGGFATAADTLAALDGAQAARIDGLWLETLTTLKPGRYGLWSRNDAHNTLREIPWQPGQTYLVSFYYRTAGLRNGEASLYLADTNPCTGNAREERLPTTEGQWRRYTVVIRNTLDKPLTLRPLIRLWAPGQVWFDQIAIRELTSSAQIDCRVTGMLH